MSLATIARPSSVSAPDTAKLLLPLGRPAATGGPPRPRSRIAGEKGDEPDGGARAAARDPFTSFQAGAGSLRRSTCSGPGSTASPITLPCSGASQLVPPCASSAQSAG